MPTHAQHSAFRGLSDEELRSRFQKTLNSPAHPDIEPAWRAWLVGYLLDHLAGRPLHSFGERRRVLAFSLRYLAAIDAGATEPVRVGQVLAVMEHRPQTVATLLFGSAAERLEALRGAFDGGNGTGALPADPYQRAVMLEYLGKFAERRGPEGGSTYDDSTVARWSRELIPEMEGLLLESLRPAGSLAQGQLIQRVVSQSAAGAPGSDRERLLGFVAALEDSPHYGLALSALNDFDRRVGLDEQSFERQRRIALIPLGCIALGIWLVPLAALPLPGLTVALRALAGLLVMVGVASLALLYQMLTRASINLTEHISRTRTDILTLQQLLDRG